MYKVFTKFEDKSEKQFYKGEELEKALKEYERLVKKHKGKEDGFVAIGYEN